MNKLYTHIYTYFFLKKRTQRKALLYDDMNIYIFYISCFKGLFVIVKNSHMHFF